MNFYIKPSLENIIVQIILNDENKTGTHSYQPAYFFKRKEKPFFYTISLKFSKKSELFQMLDRIFFLQNAQFFFK